MEYSDNFYNNIAEYSDNDLKGECVELIKNFKISEIPFHRLFHHGHEKIKLVKCSHFRRVVFLKWNPEKGIVSFDNDSSNTCELFVKQSRIRGIKKKTGSFFVKCKSQYEWETGINLLKNKIPTALPLLWAKGKLPDENYSSYLVQFSIRNTINLKEFFKTKDVKKYFSKMLRETAILFKKLQDIKFFHNDLNSKNILVNYLNNSLGGKISLSIIDLDGGKFLNEISMFKKTHNLHQFFASLPKNLKSKYALYKFIIFYIREGNKNISRLEIKQKAKIILFYMKVLSLLKPGRKLVTK